MSYEQLRGSCACGRNQYLIEIPSDDIEAAQVLFDDNADHRRAHSSPLPAFLRVPIPWLRSTTYAFYPDETHSAIRRVFTPRYAPYTKRHFCGFCGAPLSYWSEESRDEAEWVYVSLGSLERDSIGWLSDVDILPPANARSLKEERSNGTKELAKKDEGGQIRGQPWFEEIIHGSDLGRLKRRRGGETSADGRTKVEWEAVEFNSEEPERAAEGSIGTGKRKITEMTESNDVVMKGGH